MSFNINDINTISLFIALIAGLYRINNIEKESTIFIYYVVYSFINDILGILFQSIYQNNIILINFYVVASFVLLTTLFKNWKLFLDHPVLYWFLNSFVIAVWLLESFLNKDLFLLNNYSWASSSFFLVLLSIQQINKILFREKGVLILNPKFIVSFGLILIHLVYCLIALFINFKFNASNTFYLSILILHTPVSIFVNLLFAIALLLMPIRKKFLSID